VLNARHRWPLHRWALAVALISSCVLIGGCGSSPPAHSQPRLLAASHSAASPAVTRASGDSQVDIPGGDPTGTGAAMRGCPAAVDQTEAQQTSVTCLPIDRLANHTMVTMRCWVDATGSYAVPAGFLSPRWFYVTEVNGLHPGYSGYLYSGMIPPAQQVITPQCTDQILADYPFYGPRSSPAPLTLTIVGTCTTDGGTLTSRTSGFIPGTTYFIDATYPDGSAYPGLSAEPVTARPDGSVPWTWPCKGDPPGTYATSIGLGESPYFTGNIHFTIGQAPGPSTPTSPTTPPSGDGSSQPVTEQVTVYNEVTNGAISMREDTTPAYLSTVTHNYCRTNGCMLDGTEATTGATLTARCQVQGDRTTNGQDNSSFDDTNPGLFTSTLWYGITWPDGRFGYISEVWIDPTNRGGLSLPTC
jgi:hypothetical protein